MSAAKTAIANKETSKPSDLAARLRARFEPLGGADDLRIPHRGRLRDPVFTFDFDEDVEDEKPA